MTNREYIQYLLNDFRPEDITIDGLLFEADLSGDENANKNECKRAIYEHFSKLTTIVEGGFSVTVNQEAFKSWLSQLGSDIGIEGEYTLVL